MLECNQTVTVVRYNREGYVCTPIHGVSCFEKLKAAVQEKGLAAVNTFTVRIPDAALPEGFMPQVGDVVILGAVAGEIVRPSDMGANRQYTVKGVGDNRRESSRLKHVVVTGA